MMQYDTPQGLVRLRHVTMLDRFDITPQFELAKEEGGREEALEWQGGDRQGHWKASPPEPSTVLQNQLPLPVSATPVQPLSGSAIATLFPFPSVFILSQHSPTGGFVTLAIPFSLLFSTLQVACGSEQIAVFWDDHCYLLLVSLLTSLARIGAYHKIGIVVSTHFTKISRFQKPKQE